MLMNIFSLLLDTVGYNWSSQFTLKWNCLRESETKKEIPQHCKTQTSSLGSGWRHVLARYLADCDFIIPFQHTLEQ